MYVCACMTAFVCTCDMCLYFMYKYVYVCMVYVCVYMFKCIQTYEYTTCVHMCLSVLETWDLCWVTFTVALHILSISTFEMKSLPEPRTHLFGYNGWSVSPADLPVWASLARGLAGCVTMPNSYIGAELNLGPHAAAAALYQWSHLFALISCPSFASFSEFTFYLCIFNFLNLFLILFCIH